MTNAGNNAIARPITGTIGSCRPCRGRHRRIQCRQVEVARCDHRGGGRDAREHCAPFRERPRIGPILRAVHAPPADHEAGRRGRRREREHRKSEITRCRWVEHRVTPDAQAGQSEQHQRAGDPARAGRCGGVPAVAARVHRSRKLKRAVECVVQHRHCDAAYGAPAFVGRAAEFAGASHALHALDELRRDHDGHRDGDADLVERRGERSQGAFRVGEGVGGTDATENGREPHAVVQRTEDAAGADWSAERHARHERRQRDLRQREQDAVAARRTAEHDTEHDAHADDDQPEDEIGAKCARPRRVRSAGGRGNAGDDQNQSQQQRIRREACRGRETQCPDPPRDRVNRPRQAHAIQLAAGVWFAQRRFHQWLPR